MKSRNKIYAEWGAMWDAYDKSMQDNTFKNTDPKKMELNNKNSNGPAIGNMVQNIGSNIGNLMNSAATYAPQLINALLPNQPLEREKRNLIPSVNPYPQGTGSQAIYKNGGSIDRFTNLSDEEAMYYYMNNIPLPQESYPDYIQPINRNQSSAFSLNKKLVDVPAVNVPVAEPVTFESLSDRQGNRQLAPIFPDNYSYYDAMNTLPQLPDNYNGIPVMKSPELYKEIRTNVRPFTKAKDWLKSIFEDGGEIPNDLEGLDFKLPNINERYDDLSFSKAFSKARKEYGDGKIFTWRGKQYTTNLADSNKKSNNSQKQTSPKNKNVTPKNQVVNTPGTYEDFVNNVMGGNDPLQNNKYNREFLAKYSPAWASDMDLNMPNPETVYQDNRPAPRGLQKLAQNPEFNTWAENVYFPATTIQGASMVPNLVRNASKAALNAAAQSARAAERATLRNSVLQQVRNAEDDLARYNLQMAKKDAPFPIDQWKKGNPFENSGMSPIEEWANQPTITPYGSPYQQMIDAEHAWSPFQQARSSGQLQRLTNNAFIEEQAMSPVSQYVESMKKQLIDMEQAKSPIQRSGLLPKNFKNGGYIQGKEYDLTLEEINKLKKLGYEIEF